MGKVIVEIFPLNIRLIRVGLGLSQKNFGQRIVATINLPHLTHIPSSRVNEWEKHVRAVPDYVFNASALILINFWAKCRVSEKVSDVSQIDVKFAKLLNPALAAILLAEYDLRGNRPDAKHIIAVKSARMELLKFLESLLSVSFDSVFITQASVSERKSHNL